MQKAAGTFFSVPLAQFKTVKKGNQPLYSVKYILMYVELYLFILYLNSIFLFDSDKALAVR